MAALSGIPLSKAAMSHAQVPRRRHVSPLLRKGDVRPLVTIPEDYVSPTAARKAWRSRGGITFPSECAFSLMRPGETVPYLLHVWCRQLHANGRNAHGYSSQYTVQHTLATEHEMVNRCSETVCLTGDIVR